MNHSYHKSVITFNVPKGFIDILKLLAVQHNLA